MAEVTDWVKDAADEIAKYWRFGSGRDSYVTDEQRALISHNLQEVINKHCPFKPDVAYQVVPEPTLLICVDCKNTESPAGAMGRYFNQGRCLHCGGYFKVYRA